MSETTLLIEQDKHVATLWLNRPAVNNAFNATMIEELLHALDTLAHHPELRLLLLRAKGKHFSAGADLQWMKAAAQLDYQDNLKDAQQLGKLMHRLASFPTPTLAVVQGAAFGGALGLISCCDMAIATKEAIFSLSEVRLGIAPAVISPYVVHAMGARAARRYALSGERFDAFTAMKHGLLAELYPANELDAAVSQWVHTFMLNGPNAMRATKALLQEIDSHLPSTDVRAQTENTIATLRISEEGQVGLRTFFDKTTPPWQEEK